MKDSKITIEIKSKKTGFGVGYEFDYDVLEPYYDDLIDFLDNIEAEQSEKRDITNFGDMLQSVIDDALKDELFAQMSKALQELLNICVRINTNQNNNSKRDSKGRFIKKDEKDSANVKGSKSATDGSIKTKGIISPDLKHIIDNYKKQIRSLESDNAFLQNYIQSKQY